MEKQQQVEKLLTEILALMQYPARLDFKDAADGSLAVAMHFTGETPAGITAGKKSYLVDSLQFLLNKCVNRPNTERRWVLLGVGGFPEPRANRPANGPTNGAPNGAPLPAAAAVAPAAPAPARAAPSAPRSPPPPAPSAPMPTTSAATPSRPPPPRVNSRPASRSNEIDETKLQVTDDAVLAALTVSLAEKSAKLGRLYAVAMMTPEDRARALKAARGLKGSTVKVEGEGHFRRLAFVPDKATAMPKRNVAVYPDDEDEGD